MFGTLWFLAAFCSALGVAAPAQLDAVATDAPHVIVYSTDAGGCAGGQTIKLDCAKVCAATCKEGGAAGGTTMCVAAGSPTWVAADGKAAAGEYKVVVTTEGDGAMPRAWLGVRFTPVPAPLAAHIGDGGVMIANVVKGSPADAAGLQQYDVLVELQGKTVDQVQDLTAAMSEIEPGQQCTLVLVRKAQRQSCQVQLAERPAELSMDFKYPEPECSMGSDAVQAYARVLKMGEDGKWAMEDLGPMCNLPEGLSEFWTSGLGSDPGQMKLYFQKQLNGEDGESAGEEVSQRQMEWQIQVRKDDENVTVHRDADGQIHVTKVSPDGEESTAVYASEEELKENDPDVYQLYGSYHMGKSVNVVQVRPFGPHAETLRRSFQIDVNKTIEEALAQAREQCDQANEQVDKANELVKEAAKNVRVKVRRTEKDDGSQTATIVVMLTDSGLKIVVVRDGKKQEYNFANKDELQKANPELYEEVKDCLP